MLLEHSVISLNNMASDTASAKICSLIFFFAFEDLSRWCHGSGYQWPVATISTVITEVTI